MKMVSFPIWWSILDGDKIRGTRESLRGSLASGLACPVLWAQSNFWLSTHCHKYCSCNLMSLFLLHGNCKLNCYKKWSHHFPIEFSERPVQISSNTPRVYVCLQKCSTSSSHETVLCALSLHAINDIIFLSFS